MPINLLLADWGQPATLRQSSADYNPATGENIVTSTDSSVTVIPGQAVIEQNSLTTAADVTPDTTYLIPVSFLTNFQLSDAALLVGEETFRVTRIESSSLSGLAILHCTAPRP